MTQADVPDEKYTLLLVGREQIVISFRNTSKEKAVLIQQDGVARSAPVLRGR